MPATSNQKELVKLLYLEHGHQKASELSGVNYDLVRKWASLGNWKDLHKPSQSPVAVATANVESELQEHERKTKLGLSAYARRQAEHLAERGELKDHGAFRNLAAGSSTLHGWAESKQSATFSLNVLNLNLLSDSGETLDVT